MTSSLHPQTITLSSPPPPSGGLRYPLQLGGRLSRGLPQHRRRGLQRLLRPRPLGEVHGGGNAGHPARGAEHHGGRVGQSGLLRAAGTPPRQTYTPHKDTTRQTYSTRIMLMMHACLIFYYIYPPSTRHDITDTPTSSDPPCPPPLSPRPLVVLQYGACRLGQPAPGCVTTHRLAWNVDDVGMAAALSALPGIGQVGG